MTLFLADPKGFHRNREAKTLRTGLRILAIAILLAATTALSSFAQSLSGFTYNGQVYTSYQANEYQETPEGSEGTAAIRATGTAYGSMVVTQYEQTFTSNTIAPETVNSPGFDNSKNPLSPTDSAVVAAIQNMHSQGITVFLKPQVDSLDGTFRGQFAPTNVADWFASYQTFILHYAELASQNNVGGLVIGTELASLTKPAYRSYWLDLIAQVRATYPDLTLAYGANATYSADEFTTVSFWDKVDIIGVDGYFPLTNHADPTVAELVAAWTNNKDGFNIVAALKSLQSTYNKPLIFTELGYVSAPGTNETPYASAAPGALYDPAEQNNCYEAFFEVFSQQTSWMKGVFWWAWNVSPPGNSDTGYTPQNKPAANTTLVKWYGSPTPGFSLAPSTSLLTLGQGLQVSATIAVTNLGGFTGSVLLTVTGLPTGVTASFVAGTAPGTQVLTLSANGPAAAGPATLTVTGTSGSLLATTTIALTVRGAAAQSITFANPGAQIVGTPLYLSATSSSDLAVSFTSATPTVCVVSVNVATFVATGTCIIDADQPGDGSYLAAPQVQQSFLVAAPASFTIRPASTALSITQGGTASGAINITGANGFSGNVTLMVSGLPSGVAATFATNPTSASSALTLAATTSAPVGITIITITGTSGTLTAATTIALTISSAPGFTLMPLSPSVSVTSGSSTTEAISISGSGGFAGTVSLSAAITSSPQGAQNLPTLSFGTTSPLKVSAGGGSATLSIYTTSATSAALDQPAHRNLFLKFNGGALVCLLLMGIPAKARKWLPLLRLFGLLFALAGSLVGCGGGGSSSAHSTGNPGTTPGSYTVTVTGTSGPVNATVPLTLTVY